MLLNEVFVGRVDILISEDKKIHKKARELKIEDKVFTIDSFLEKTFAEHPDLVNYKVLNVQKLKFGRINLEDDFFASLKEDYVGFDRWFVKKYDDEAYITVNSNNGLLLSFLYLKVTATNQPVGANVEFWAMSHPPAGINLGVANPCEIDPAFFFAVMQVPIYIRYSQHGYYSDWKQVMVDITE